jgi:uncharacterized protein (TIGR03083 family)
VNQLRELVAVWREQCRELSALVRRLDELDWALPTDLSGWSVQDVFAHCVALESELSGVEPLRVQIDKTAAHIKNAAGVYTERGVVGRRGRTPAELIDEFEEAVERRAALLDAEPLDDPTGTPPITPGRIGWDWATLLRNRPIDLWVHEQDIRRAVGKPGGFGTVGARHTQGVFALALPYVVAKRAAAPPRTTVVVYITGEVTARYGVVVDESRRGHPADPASIEPTVQLTMNTETFTVLGASRREAVGLPIQIDGDHELAATILSQLGLIPF